MPDGHDEERLHIERKDFAPLWAVLCRSESQAVPDSAGAGLVTDRASECQRCSQAGQKQTRCQRVWRMRDRPRPFPLPRRRNVLWRRVALQVAYA
jgi:hypothetical protein